MATAVTDDVKRLREAESQFSSTAEPWLSRLEWLWTLVGVGLVITLLGMVVERP